METIRVNMTPCEDIKTIHASQNDNEAREWGFELHNNGEKIDSSSITDQLVFKAYEGGTEQILPENTSTPTTSPFKGDIKYPQGLLSDQEFLYRESPTEEDGLAWIKSIKGNTLVWNQLVQNGNFASTSGWGQGGGRSTLTVANNIGTATLVNTLSTTYQNYGDVQLVQGHKILIHYEFKLPRATQRVFGCENNDTTYSFGVVQDVSANTWHSVNAIHTVVLGGAEKITICYFYTNRDGYELGDQYQVKNLMVFDLTQMGLDITASDFTSLFPLPYYAYNQGTLLSFNGNGIKTVGFNQWDEEWELGSINNDTGQNSPSTSTIRSKNYFSVLPNKEYYLHASVASTFNYRFYDVDKRFISGGYIGRNNTILIPNGVAYMRFYMGSAYGTTYNHDICINISDSSKNGTYEPYTSSTLSLPISTYFPNGMDGVGTDYDELTNTKATTRMTRVDLGSLNWTYDSSVPRFYSTAISSVVAKPLNDSTMANILCSKYATSAVSASSGGIYASGTDKLIAVGTTGTLNVKDSSYTDATTFKSAMSGVYLVYPLATPIETSFTTASLVTENAEIPLSNEDGVLIGKCTEQLSAEPGFHDAKIKLADKDGECYSNKIQLHVERSPQ